MTTFLCTKIVQMLKYKMQVVTLYTGETQM